MQPSEVSKEAHSNINTLVEFRKKLTSAMTNKLSEAAQVTLGITDLFKIAYKGYSFFQDLTMTDISRFTYLCNNQKWLKEDQSKLSINDIDIVERAIEGMKNLNVKLVGIDDSVKKLRTFTIMSVATSIFCMLGVVFSLVIGAGKFAIVPLLMSGVVLKVGQSYAQKSFNEAENKTKGLDGNLLAGGEMIDAVFSRIKAKA